ncbi:MAG: alpha-1,2-fucosyltransferase [Patescibacteria group bacterium]
MSIIVRIQGGTGNQLFQYAFARGIASRLGVDYLIDRKVCDNALWDPHKIHRKYSLDLFNTKIKFAEDNDMCGFIWLRKHHRLFDSFHRLIRGRRLFLPFYYKEQTFAYNPNVLKRKDNTYYDGYWQTEKYFKHIEDEIRTEITSQKPLSLQNKAILEEIKKVNAVSLHVRRGDYVTDPVAVVHHGVCSPEYYKKAIAYIEKNVSNPHFFIFSDDFQWSVENFKSLKHPIVCVRGNEASDYEDLALIRECKHHIISNSSFGWWGAWLNPSKNKIVIGPKKWFKGLDKVDISDIFPSNWIKF